MEGLTSIPCIVAICYLIGMGCKAAEKIKDNFIPVICGASGLVLGVIAYLAVPQLTIANDILTAAAVGVVSGLTATGVHQIGKQLTKED